jgi:hypothetical protein
LFYLQAIYNMILRLIKAIWFLSMLAALANLLYVYAGLPETVVVHEQGIEQHSLGREAVFYGALVLLALANLMVYVFGKKLMPDDWFRGWLHGLVVTFNIFSIIGLSFLGLFNSTEKFDFSRIGFIIYASVGLMVLWAAGWPVLSAIRKFISKS